MTGCRSFSFARRSTACVSSTPGAAPRTSSPLTNTRAPSGLLATAGHLVFGCTVGGFFFPLDAESGRELWHVAVGARVHSAPITYAVNGPQRRTHPPRQTVFSFRRCFC